MYDSGGDGDRDDGVSSSGVGGGDRWAERTDSMLDLASDSYSDFKISVGNSRPSSCPTYTIY